MSVTTTYRPVPTAEEEQEQDAAAAESPTTTSGGSPSLLEEIQEVLPQSYLIFLVADLRLMSATGRIETRYETIAIDSDRIPRTSAANLAGLANAVVPAAAPSSSPPPPPPPAPGLLPGPAAAAGGGGRGEDKTQDEGLSPAQIMAILLLEIDKCVQVAKRKEGEATRSRGGNVGAAEGGENSEGDDDDDERAARFLSDRKRRAGGKEKKKLWEAAEDSMNVLLRAYAQMVANDVTSEVPHVQRRLSQMKLERSVSLAQIAEEDEDEGTLEEGTEAAEGLEREVGCGEGRVPAREDPHRNASAEDGKAKEEGQLSAMDRILRDEEEEEKEEREGGGEGQVPARDSPNAAEDGKAEDEEGDAEPQSALGQMGQRLLGGKFPGSVPVIRAPSAAMLLTESKRRRPQELAQSITNAAVTMLKSNDSEVRTKMEFEELADAVFVAGSGNRDVRRSMGVASSGSGIGGSGSAGAAATLTREEMRRVMLTAVESRQYDRLDFMPKFFRDGTVSQLMARSTSRILWMNDWYPLKDLTYAIAVDKEKKRVLVVFRGAITKADWSHATEAKFVHDRNPIREDFDGKPDEIDVHGGFHKYLFRVRQDTKTKKYDEVANLAHKYGLEKIGPDYHLVVTGHSLGAALSTVFGFYASTDERFTRNGPVKVFTFGSPYVGGHYFADAFRHQERSLKLQYARIFNQNDVATHLPPNMSINKRGCFFRHVGIGIELPSIPHGFSKHVCRRKWHPRVFYDDDRSCFPSTTRGLRDNFLFYWPWLRPWKMAKRHTLFELQDRLIIGSMLQEKTGDFDLLRKPIDKLYEILVGDYNNTTRVHDDPVSSWPAASAAAATRRGT